MVAYFLLGFVVCAVIGVVFIDRNLFSISHKLDMFSQQTTMTLTQMNSPALNSVINQATTSARAEGIDNGLQISLLAMFKMWSDGDIVDYKSIADVVIKNVKTFGSNQKEYQKWSKKYQEYATQNGIDSEDDDDEY